MNDQYKTRRSLITLLLLGIFVIPTSLISYVPTAAAISNLVDIEPAASLVDNAEISCNPDIIQYRFNEPVNYRDVQLIWYFSDGFFKTFESNIAENVRFYKKDTGEEVILPNIVTQPLNNGFMEITDWWFKQIKGRSPLGLTLESRELEPSTVYIIEIDKDFQFNNGNILENTYTFEFATADENLINNSALENETKTEVSGTAKYDDIVGHWAQKYIEQVTADGVMNGYSNANFRPNSNITRAEFTAALIKVLGLEIQTGQVFADTANHPNRDYISTAAACNIVNGYDNAVFCPEDPITREQMALMIYRAQNMNTITAGTVFADYEQISSWALEAVSSISADSIMFGYPDNTFQPQAYASRAEAASVISRL